MKIWLVKLLNTINVSGEYETKFSIVKQEKCNYYLNENTNEWCSENGLLYRFISSVYEVKEHYDSIYCEIGLDHEPTLEEQNKIKKEMLNKIHEYLDNKLYQQIKANKLRTYSLLNFEKEQC